MVEKSKIFFFSSLRAGTSRMGPGDRGESRGVGRALWLEVEHMHEVLFKDTKQQSCEM